MNICEEGSIVQEGALVEWIGDTKSYGIVVKSEGVYAMHRYDVFWADTGLAKLCWTISDFAENRVNKLLIVVIR